MRLGVALFGVLVGCGEKSIEMTLELPVDQERWDTSCVQTIEVFTEGLNYPEQSDDYIGQTLDTSDARPQSYADILRTVSGKFDVAIPTTGLSGIEMYGWNGPSGFFNASAFPELVFYARVPYVGQDLVTIPLIPNLDCRTSNVVVRPIDLITLVTTKNCTMAAVSDAQQGFVSIGTLSPGLFKEYLFDWGGLHGAPVTAGASSFMASTTVGPGSCLAVYGDTLTSSSAGCMTATKACATGSDIETVLIDHAYAQSSLDTAIQEDLRGGTIVAVLDATRTAVVGATVEIPADQGQVVFVNLDTTAKHLMPATGTATTASGMFILYSNDLVDAKVTSGGTTKTVRLGAPRTYNDGTKAPAGAIVTF